jgi:hypothetical protein
MTSTLDKAQTCAVHSVHHPSVAKIIDLPLLPQSLQAELQVGAVDVETVSICPTGAANVEVCWKYMLGRGPAPEVRLGPATWDLAQRIVHNYEQRRPAV